VWLYFIPLYIAGAIIFMLALFTLLARVRGGKYARPIMQGIANSKATMTLRKKPSRLSRRTR